MNIGIAGAGVCGSLLSVILPESHSVSVVDIRSEENIGQDCARATGEHEFKKVCREVGLNPDDYILYKAKKVMSAVASIKDTIILDKSQFLKDVRSKSDSDFHFRNTIENHHKYDLIIDATGNRAFLEENSGYTVPCYQLELIGSGFSEDIYIDLKPEIGYLWSFPQGQDVFRVGCALLKGNPKTYVDEFLENREYKVIGNRSGSVRLSSPLRDTIYEEVNGVPTVGVGESVGTVDPLSGEGIVPSIKSAEILASSLREDREWPGNYERRLKKEFHWVESRLRLIDSLVQGKTLSKILNLLKFETPDYLSGEVSKLRMALRGW